MKAIFQSFGGFGRYLVDTISDEYCFVAESVHKKVHVRMIQYIDGANNMKWPFKSEEYITSFYAGKSRLTYLNEPVDILKEMLK